MIRKRDAWIPAALLAVVLAGASCSKGGGDGRPTPTSPGGGGTGSLELNSPSLAPGDTYEHRFWAAGNYSYYCIYHAPMTGVVIVDANALDTLVTVSITNAVSPFPTVGVKPGGRVVWTNNSIMAHTVTSQ